MMAPRVAHVSPYDQAISPIDKKVGRVTEMHVMSHMTLRATDLSSFSSECPGGIWPAVKLQHITAPLCMPGTTAGRSKFTCARCLRAQRALLSANTHRGTRLASSKAQSPPISTGKHGGSEKHGTGEQVDDAPEQGAMFRRLQEMTDANLETGGRSARKAVEEAGFSEELKKQLEEKIASASFRSDNAGAFAQTNLPASAPKHARDIAASRPWTGTESVEDASLRMLNDAHKPIRGPPKVPGIGGPPAKVDTGRPSTKNDGTRLANARDKSSFYSFAKDTGLSEEEKDKFRQQMKARFQPGARSIPATLQGLASLANERIEDAIARGQFKNLPRGQKIERDYTASSPFINTTEYFMNKIIKKQDIVPPWIEKQQEVVSTANRFRGRLRADWKRHVSRAIASRGGSLESQVKLAEEYAFAERIENPTKKQVEIVNTVDEQGHLSKITIAGELKPEAIDDASAIEEEIKVMEQTFNDDGTLKPVEEQINISAVVTQTQASPPEPPRAPTVPAFRDHQWEQTERSYHSLAIENLNSLTRSYNLMAPNLAKKPYFSLERELRSCFADVAPLVADAIRERALAPRIKGVEIIGHKPGGVLDRFAMNKAGHVYDERKPQYGFKEFWRDLWKAKT